MKKTSGESTLDNQNNSCSRKIRQQWSIKGAEKNVILWNPFSTGRWLI